MRARLRRTASECSLQLVWFKREKRALHTGAESGGILDASRKELRMRVKQVILGMAILLATHGTQALAAPDALTEGPGNDTEAAWSPDGRQVVFQSDRNGDLDLYVMDLASRQVRPLVTGPGHACFPAWSPDGQWIVYAFAHFTKTAVQGIEDGYNLFVVPAAGGEPRRLTRGPFRDYTPTFSRDGRSIYFSSTRGAEQSSVGLYRVPFEGGEPERVLHHDGPDVALVQPDLSPDGRLIAVGHIAGFRGNWSVRLLRTATPDAEFALTGPDAPLYSPRWSPDGRLIACTGYRVGDPGWGIYLVELRTGSAVRLDTGPGNSRSPAWSPDGKTLLFENNRTGSYKLYRMEVPRVSFPPVKAEAIRTDPPVFQLALKESTGTEVKDASALGNHGRVLGTVGREEGALVFTGQGSITVPQPKGFDFGTGTFAVRVVLTVEKHTDALRIVAVGDYPTHHLGWQIYLGPDNRAWFNARDPGGLFVGAASDRPVPVGRKVTLVGIRHASGRVELHLDGRVQASAGAGAVMSYPVPTQVRIGSQYDGASPFAGRLHEMAVYRRPLTGREGGAPTLAEFLGEAK